MEGYAEFLNDQRRNRDMEWAFTQNPMSVMRMYIRQDIDLINWIGKKRIEKDAYDFDSPQYIIPDLTGEEWEAKAKLYEQLKIIENAWKKVCEIEEKLEY